MSAVQEQTLIHLYDVDEGLPKPSKKNDGLRKRLTRANRVLVRIIAFLSIEGGTTANRFEDTLAVR